VGPDRHQASSSWEVWPGAASEAERVPAGAALAAAHAQCWSVRFVTARSREQHESTAPRRRQDEQNAHPHPEEEYMSCCERSASRSSRRLPLAALHSPRPRLAALMVADTAAARASVASAMTEATTATALATAMSPTGTIRASIAGNRRCEVVHTIEPQGRSSWGSFICGPDVCFRQERHTNGLQT
jgi:hypothetical protein